MITLDSMVRGGVGPTQARAFLESLTAAMNQFDINTDAQQAAFIAQCMVESQNFVKLEENCNWSDPTRIQYYFHRSVPSIKDALPLVHNPQGLANVVYAGKNGNGGVETCDGWQYRGRGLIQLTGRGNYGEAESGLARPYIASPELVADPVDACLTAAWFWSSHGLNTLADAWLIDSITRVINGPAMDQSDLRKQYSEQMVKAISQ